MHLHHSTGAAGQEHRGGVAALLDRAEHADAGATVSEDLGRALRDGTAHDVLVATRGDVVVGVAFTAPQGDRLAAELVVAPEARRRGVGTALLPDLLTRAPGEIWLWSHGDHPAARVLAQRFGLDRARELLQLRVPVGPTSDLASRSPVATPDGVRVRTLDPTDTDLVEAVVAVNNLAFAWHPEGAKTVEDLDVRDVDPAGFFLAVLDPAQDPALHEQLPHGVLGFHWTKVHPPSGGEPVLGEIYVLGVHPGAHGRGVGGLLTDVGLRHLATVPGVEQVELYTEGDNAAALHVYRRQGFHDHRVDVAYRR